MPLDNLFFLPQAWTQDQQCSWRVSLDSQPQNHPAAMLYSFALVMALSLIRVLYIHLGTNIKCIYYMGKHLSDMVLSKWHNIHIDIYIGLEAWAITCYSNSLWMTIQIAYETFLYKCAAEVSKVIYGYDRNTDKSQIPNLYWLHPAANELNGYM